MAGWEGNAYWFRIEGDAIVAGRLDEKIPHNEFLCTTQNYDDFELRLEAKLVGEGTECGDSVPLQACSRQHRGIGVPGRHGCRLGSAGVGSSLR